MPATGEAEKQANNPKWQDKAVAEVCLRHGQKANSRNRLWAARAKEEDG